MSYSAAVKDAAEKLNLLDPDGQLVELDSLTVLDLVGELERSTQLSIPTTDMRVEHFSSIDTVASLLAAIAKR